MRNLIYILLIGVFTFSCTNKPLKTSDVVLKRNWVRRVAPESSLLRNSSSQRFYPLLLNNIVIQASTFGGIKVFSKKTGRVKWSIESEAGVSSHGRVAAGHLFFGSYDRKASAYSIQERTFKWSVALDSSPLSFSQPLDGKVFVMTDLGTLYALSVDSGVVLWNKKRPARKALQIFGAPSPLIFQDQVIAAFPDGTVASFQQSSGKQKWVLQFDSYQKFEDADFLELDGMNLLVGSFDEAVYNVNPDNGSIKWRVLQGPVSSVAIDGSRLYYSSNKGELISLEKSSGKIVFQKSFMKGVGNKPVILKNHLVISDSKGPVYVLDKNLGEVVARYESGSPISSPFSVDASKEKLYFLSNKGNLFKFGIEREYKW